MALLKRCLPREAHHLSLVDDKPARDTDFRALPENTAVLEGAPHEMVLIRNRDEMRSRFRKNANIVRSRYILKLM